MTDRLRDQPTLSAEIRLDDEDREAQPIPLSPAQLGLWLQQESLGYRPAFHIAVFLDVEAAVDHAVLEAAITQVQFCTDALDMRYERDGPELKQFAGNPVAFSIPLHDFSANANPETAALEWMRQESDTLFSFAGDRLCRFAQLVLGDERTFLYFKFHHLVLDGWGLTLFLKRLATAYTHLSTGSPSPPERITSSTDILRKNASRENSTRSKAAKKFWNAYLVDLPSPVVDKLAKTPSSEKPSDVAIAAMPLAPAAWRDLEGLSRANGLSPTVFAIAVIAGYLARLTGSFDLCVALPRLNRDRDALRSVAMLVNLAALRLALRPSDTVLSIAA
ncbi:MAG: condensation domain-containing protein, partial [Pseudomonadota bacterium]